MDVEKQIEELSKYQGRESLSVRGVVENLQQFEEDLGEVVNVLESKVEDVDRRRAEHQRQIQNLTEKLEAVEIESKMVQKSRDEAKAREEEIRRQLRNAEERLQKVEEEFSILKSEANSALKNAENIPKLSQYKKLMYKISKMTFDQKKEDHIKGFVVNTRLDDVHVFDFNTQNHSAQFISNYVWDLIAGSADKAWRL